MEQYETRQSPAERPPRTAVAMIFAVYRGPSADAMLPLTVVVPWCNLQDVARVDLVFHVPAGYEVEIVQGDPTFLLCSCRVVPGEVVEPMRGELPVCVEVAVSSASESFSFGTKFTNARGTAGMQVGRSGEPMHVHAFGRVIDHSPPVAQEEAVLAHA